MKKIFLLIMMLIMVLTMTACTETTNYKIMGNYDRETSEYVIKNISHSDYKDLEVELIIESANGYSKRIAYEVGDLDSQDEYRIDLSDVSDASNVYMEAYNYYVSVWEYIFILVIILLFTLLIILVFD